MLLRYSRYNGRSFGLVDGPGDSMPGLPWLVENDRLIVSFLTQLTERENETLGCSSSLAKRPEYEEAVELAMTCGAPCNGCLPLASNFALTSI